MSRWNRKSGVPRRCRGGHRLRGIEIVRGAQFLQIRKVAHLQACSAVACVTAS
jgi:hypothetical protein